MLWQRNEGKLMKRIFKMIVLFTFFMLIQSYTVKATLNLTGNEVNIIKKVNSNDSVILLNEQMDNVHIHRILSLDTMIHEFETENEDNNQSINNTLKEEAAVSSASDDKYPVELILYKAFEMDSKGESTQWIAEFEIIDQNGRQIDTFKSDQQGIGIWQGSLEIGSYAIREINTEPNYLIDERSFGFNVMGKANEVILINEGEAIVNRLQKNVIDPTEDIKQIFTDSEFSLDDKDVEFIDKGMSVNNFYFKEMQVLKDYALDVTLRKIELLEDTINKRSERLNVYAETVKQDDYEDVLSAIVLASILLIIIIGYKRYKNTL